MFTAFFAQTFNSSLIVADYYTNTKSFVTHCENKSKPQLHCNGKCQMIKQIKNEERKDQQNPERKDNKNEIICLIEQSSFIKNPYFVLHSKKYASLSNSEEIRMPRSILRPPIM